jgi:dTMP kinase
MSQLAGEQASGGGFRAAIRASGFRRLLIGQAVSSLGDWVATLAFIAAAFTLTHGNQTAVAAVLVLRLVPPIFAAPVGGVVADRVYRRTIMVTCDLTRAALIALAPFVGIAVLYVIAFVHESISLFFLPARDASVPLLVPSTALAEANGLVLATSYGSIPIAAAVFSGLSAVESHIPHALPFAGLFTRHRNTFAFFFDSATFVFSASMIAQLQLKRVRRQHVQIVEGVVEGFRYVVSKQGLRSLALGVVVSMFGGGVLFAVGIGYIHETLHGNDVAFGWLTALWGAGMGLGLIIVRLLIKDRGRAPTFLLAVTMCGAVLIVMAVLPFLWLSFVAAVLFGTAFSVAILVALTTAQEMTEDRIRGRIMGGVQMLFRVGLGVGALGVGALAHAVRHVRFIISLDGNQVGLIAGGLLILVGAMAASGLRMVGGGAPR